MAHDISRRQALRGAAGIGVVTGIGVLGTPWANLAYAARDQVTVRTEGDLRNLDPANRTSPIDANVILAVCHGLVRFKPGSTDYAPDAAATITQPSDTLIEFTLKPGIKFTGGYGDLTAEDVKFSFERFIKPGPDGKKVTYAADWSALDNVEVTGPLSGKIHLKAPAPGLWVIALADASGAIVSKKAFTELGPKVSTTLIGSGPYVLKEWVPRDHFLLEANPGLRRHQAAFREDPRQADHRGQDRRTRLPRRRTPVHPHRSGRRRQPRHRARRQDHRHERDRLHLARSEHGAEAV